ncbi:MAG: capping complex subunit for YIEGIA [Syntrophomonadaceae bacterium]
MDIEIKEFILAIVTRDINKVKSGICPVFLAESQDEQEKICLYLARILGGIVHDLENGVMFICKH